MFYSGHRSGNGRKCSGLEHRFISRRRQMILLCSVRLTEAQKKQLEECAELIQEECISENADNSTEDPIEGGLDADGDGEDMTDGIEEDFDEDGSSELVRH